MARPVSAPDGAIITALCSTGVAVLSFLSATRAAHPKPTPAAPEPETGPPAPEPVQLEPAPATPDPSPAAGPAVTRIMRATGTVDLTVTLTEEGPPRMPGKKRYQLKPEPGDGRMLPEPAEEPADADQVLNEEMTPGDYAGDPEGGEA
jgi:hypothetical protein